jgi:hypothetical protein
MTIAGRALPVPVLLIAFAVQVAPVQALSGTQKLRAAPAQFLAPKFSGEAGFRGAAGRDSRLSVLGRGYLEPTAAWKPTEHSVISLQLQGRGWVQSEVQSGARQDRWAVEVRDSYVSLDTDSNRLRLGFQSLSWGETFGFFIADLPNPRDLSDPLLLEIGHVKKPVFMLQEQWFYDGGAIQAFFTPIARHTDFFVELPRGEFKRVGADSEYGLKANHLFGFGLDASAFVLRHKERSFMLDPKSIWSAGVSATQSFGQDWIVRTDQVISDEWQSTEGWRGVLGIDWTATQNLTLSLQGQRDPLNSGGSLRMMLRGFEGILEGWEFEAFWFQGLENNETWVQPKLSYHSSGGCSISARYDWIEASALQPGLLSTLAPEDRALIWLTYGF